MAHINWRDDMKFLFELGNNYRFYKENGNFPQIKFRNLPNLSNARWNSRAILALLAFILLPHQRECLKSICDFVTGTWFDLWFSDQFYQAGAYGLLIASVESWPKASNTVRKFWSEEPTSIDTQRSNICAERAVKVMESLKAKKIRNKNLHFLLSNNDS